jgi:hypothetical protein
MLCASTSEQQANKKLGKLPEVSINRAVAIQPHSPTMGLHHHESMILMCGGSAGERNGERVRRRSEL